MADTRTPPVPSALDGFEDFLVSLAGRAPAVFLDYDGTLTPIMPRPDLAVLDVSVRTGIERLSGLCPVAVVSGRDLEDVARLMGLPGLVYAGSHGFDIRGPELRVQIGAEHGPALDRAETALRRDLAGIDGALVERKRFAIAIHTRLVAAEHKPAVADAVRRQAAAEDGLRVTGGKEIHELRPNVPWDKGRAVLSLLDRLGLADDAVHPVYIGDDETDEDAFRALAGHGTGIRVMDEPAPTAAGWRLRDPGEAAVFLARLADALDGGRPAVASDL